MRIRHARARRPSARRCGSRAASDKFDSLLGDPTALAVFLKGVPKGGDLHNHLTGAVYAETYLDWGKADGDCVNNSSHSAVASSSCSATNVAMPTSGAFFDSIVRAWSMQDFVAGAENGHDHFFATFGKYGLVAGAHRDETLADVAHARRRRERGLRRDHVQPRQEHGHARRVGLDGHAHRR